MKQTELQWLQQPSQLKGNKRTARGVELLLTFHEMREYL
jgi:hypothetical protein